MGISAVVGQTALGTLGAGCCKAMTVKKDNNRMKKLLKMVGLKSLEEIAMTDAIATVKQVAKLRPDWFIFDDEDKRKRTQPTRLGVNTDYSQILRIDHEAIVKAKLPCGIAKEIYSSGALIGDIWQLAVRKLIDDFENKEELNSFIFKYKYEELWLSAEMVCKEQNKNCTNIEIIKTYHVACSEYLDLLDRQARRIANLTVTRPLMAHQTCNVSPPRWHTRKKKASKYGFNCKKKPPDGDLGDEMYACVVCGTGLNKYGDDCGICKLCSRPAHIECLDRLLLAFEFRCKDILRPLAGPGVETVCTSKIEPKPLRFEDQCLVCGDELVSDRLSCRHNNCKYGAHEYCAAIICKVNSGNLVSSEFECNDINYYLKPVEIKKFCKNEMDVDDIKQILKRRGKVNCKKYSPVRKRYANPDIECDRCGKTVGINELDHELTYCSASSVGTPVPKRDYHTSFSKLKRLRRIALSDYPP